MDYNSLSKRNIHIHTENKQIQIEQRRGLFLTVNVEGVVVELEDCHFTVVMKNHENILSPEEKFEE